MYQKLHLKFTVSYMKSRSLIYRQRYIYAAVLRARSGYRQNPSLIDLVGVVSGKSFVLVNRT